jgi:hypothetical protein
MRLSIRLIALPLALALSAGARADAVETLKSSLPNKGGFEVENSRSGQGGVTCITYKIANDYGGKSRNHAIVDGDKVMRESMGDSHFAKAWNEKCAAK